jgi:hypothetical protein
MALRIELREGEYLIINGVPIAVATARDKRAVFTVGDVNDETGEPRDEPEEAKRLAAKIRDRVDKRRRGG